MRSLLAKRSAAQASPPSLTPASTSVRPYWSLLRKSYRRDRAVAPAENDGCRCAIAAGHARFNIGAALPPYPQQTYPGAPRIRRAIISSMSLVLHWNGKDLPPELRSLPEGRYVLDPVDAAPALSPDEEAGLETALASLRQGRGIEADTVLHRVEERLRR